MQSWLRVPHGARMKSKYVDGKRRSKKGEQNLLFYCGAYLRKSELENNLAAREISVLDPMTIEGQSPKAHIKLNEKSRSSSKFSP